MGPIQRVDELTYLRQVEALANAVCEQAFAEGWLAYADDPTDATALQKAVNELARNLRHEHFEGDGCLEEDGDA